MKQSTESAAAMVDGGSDVPAHQPDITPADGAEKSPAPGPMLAARAEDDPMSGQQAQSIPAAELPPERQARAVLYAWDDLTEDEVLKSRDRRQVRSNRARERYAPTHDGDDAESRTLYT